jgi:transcriptional regulator with XRE-family HTH domain
MANTMTAAVTPGRFPVELREWRVRRGLSQLDLAIRTGTTQRHLSYIEQGRSAPGRTMVVRLAESLDLSLRDRNGLLVTAGFAPLFPESDLQGPELRPVREALTTILEGHEPYPAVVVRSGGELIATNSAVEVLFEGVAAELLETPRNAYRIALHPLGMAPRIRNFPEWANHVLNALRSASRRSPSDRLDQLLNELESYVPVHAPGRDHLGFAVPLRLAAADGDLTLITTITSFATATDVTLAGLQLEAFLPADAETTRILRARAETRSLGETTLTR